MKTNFKIIHEKFKLNGFHYSNENLLELAFNFLKEGKLYEQEIGKFLQKWLNDDDFIEMTSHKN